jgi:hypothetical protein
MAAQAATHDNNQEVTCCGGHLSAHCRRLPWVADDFAMLRIASAMTERCGAHLRCLPYNGGGDAHAMDAGVSNVTEFAKNIAWQ